VKKGAAPPMHGALIQAYRRGLHNVHVPPLFIGDACSPSGVIAHPEIGRVAIVALCDIPALVLLATSVTTGRRVSVEAGEHECCTALVRQAPSVLTSCCEASWGADSQRLTNHMRMAQLAVQALTDGPLGPEYGPSAFTAAAAVYQAVAKAQHRAHLCTVWHLPTACGKQAASCVSKQLVTATTTVARYALAVASDSQTERTPLDLAETAAAALLRESSQHGCEGSAGDLMRLFASWALEAHCLRHSWRAVCWGFQVPATCPPPSPTCVRAVSVEKPQSHVHLPFAAKLVTSCPQLPSRIRRSFIPRLATATRPKPAPTTGIQAAAPEWTGVPVASINLATSDGSAAASCLSGPSSAMPTHTPSPGGAAEGQTAS
jgi:hypothetical protein